jgi:chemotaxis protein MotB
MVRNIFLGGLICVLVLSLSGCAVSFYKASPRDKLKIKELSSEVDRLEALRAEETARMQDAMEDLRKRLGSEIRDKQVRLEMAERGLVITFVAEVLFDSGKAKVRSEAYSVLNKVADVIRDRVPDRDIGVEGHTDNVPITYSNWKSNWELSTARATSVLHYLIEKAMIEPEKLSAIGYGEYRPIASNEDDKGRKLNRRVEIVILPKTTEKLRAEMLEQEAQLSQDIK